MNDKTKYELGGILIGGLLVWIFISGYGRTGNWTMMNSYNGNQDYRSSGMMNNPGIDSHFIEQMIPHHDSAITMSKLALTKAKKPEVRQLAQNIIDSQSKEMNQMKSWYKDWFGKEVPATSNEGNNNSGGMMGGNGNRMMSGGMMGDSSDTSSLEQAADFDKAFLEEMIPHHQMAVMMATMLKSGTNRPEMAKLADDIIEAQTSEINQMRGWLKNW